MRTWIPLVPALVLLALPGCTRHPSRPRSARAPAAQASAHGGGATLVYLNGDRQCGIITRLAREGCVTAWTVDMAGADTTRAPVRIAAGGPTHLACGATSAVCGTQVSCDCGAPREGAPRHGEALGLGVATRAGESCSVSLVPTQDGCIYQERRGGGGHFVDGPKIRVPCGAAAPGLTCWGGHLTCDCPEPAGGARVRGRPAPAIVPPTPIDPAACKPVYPKAALRKRAFGTVTVSFTVDTAGNVTGLAIVHSVPALDDAVRDALARCRYRPATRGGVPIKVTVHRNFRFDLPDKPPGVGGRPSPKRTPR